MLSISHSFLFVHIPKTAGNSLQNIFAPYSDDILTTPSPWQDGVERFELKNSRYPTRKHTTLDEYYRIYPAEMFRSLVKFTVIRNTYERVISHYFSPHRGAVSWNRDKFIDFVKTIVKPVGFYISYPGQSLDEAIQNLDYILRFERLESEFQGLCLKLGICTSELPVRNKSQRGEFLSYYDSGLIELVYDHFKDEIDLFGFTPIFGGTSSG